MSPIGRLACAGVLATGLLYATTSSAIPLSGGEWSLFDFAEEGSSWESTFEFRVVGTAQLKVTDLFLSGDRFAVSDKGAFLFETSAPGSVGDFTGDPDEAFSDPRWSSGLFLLGTGTYGISGTAILSPFFTGAGAVRVDAIDGTVAPVPVPAGSLLLVSGLGLGLAAIRRKRL